MRAVILLLILAVAMVGCAKPPEQTYFHPKTGKDNLVTHLEECGDVAERFGIINMSPVHNYPMEDMKDRFQRNKVFNFCMLKKGYEQNDTVAYTIDGNNTRILLSDASLSAGETSLVTIVFNSPVGGLENSDLTVENGSLSVINTVDKGLTWTATFTPVPGLEDQSNSIRLDNSGVINGVTNPGIGVTVSGNYTIDTLRPTVAINIGDNGTDPDDRNSLTDSSSANYAEGDIYAINTHQTAVINFNFSEAPINFSKNDITVTNGTLSALVKDEPTRYHALFTANENFKGQAMITVKASRFTDMARNGNEAAKPGIVAIDTLRPTITASVDTTSASLR